MEAGPQPATTCGEPSADPRCKKKVRLIVRPVNNWTPELADRDGEQNRPLVIQGEAVSELLRHSDVDKSMGTDRIHPRMMCELVEELTKPLSIIYQQPWLTSDPPGGCGEGCVYLALNENFDTVSHSKILEKLAARSLEKSTP
ncbi:hypothetical protein TURU_093178 [Turdus rufiventris]|nr:hypothetical protein TURU_093178 [Turdus rufiventris]